MENQKAHFYFSIFTYAFHLASKELSVQDKQKSGENDTYISSNVVTSAIVNRLQAEFSCYRI